MLRRYSKARTASNTSSVNGDIPTNSKPPIADVGEKRVQDLSKALEECEKTAKQVSNSVSF